MILTSLGETMITKYLLTPGKFVSAFIVICTLGCVQPKPPVVAKPRYLEHQIKFSGETVGAIAAWYTGNRKNYTAILSENPALNPKKLAMGATIRIPVEMLVRTDPLPKSAVGGTSKKSAPETPAIPIKTEELAAGVNLEPKTEPTPEEAKKDDVTAVPEGTPSAPTPEATATVDATPNAASPVAAPAETPIEATSPVKAEAGESGAIDAKKDGADAAPKKKSLLEEMLDGQ